MPLGQDGSGRRYTFGDDAAAAERLALVAEAYRATSSAFLADGAPGGAAVAVDLGCGPGHSTELLGDACRPRRLIGLDASVAFVDRARRRVPRASFLVHDATTGPLPAPAAHVLYARLLLAHLPDPLGLVGRWRSALAPGGVLLVEDLDHVDAPDGPLQDYDSLSTQTVRAGGGPMDAGRVLATLGGRLVEVRVPAAAAARVDLVNVDRWLAEPGRAPDRRRLLELRAGLRDLADGGAGSVSWVVRQLALPAT